LEVEQRFFKVKKAAAGVFAQATRRSAEVQRQLHQQLQAEIPRFATE
jgi:hypothetical protein